MSSLREKQLEMLSMLKRIDKVCKDNDIKYTLVWGTALGAIRHKGFIPWDDDADISMLWADYKKFIKIWKRENSDDKYFIQSYDSDKRYPMLYAKLRSRKIMVKERYFEKMGLEEGIWIDIFPIINISNNSVIRRLQYTAIKIANFLNHKYFYLSDNEFVNKHHTRVKFKKFCFRLLPNTICRCISKILINIAYSVKESDVVEDISCKYIMKKKYFENLEYMKFEDTEMPVPQDWDEYLTRCYGDYMTPVKYGHDITEG